MSARPDATRLAALAALAICALARSASAQGVADDAALTEQRRALLDQAQEASDAGDHARALDLAERAGQLRMSASLQRFIAEERVATGALGEAYAAAHACAFEAEGDPPSENRDRVLAGCRALVASLEHRVGRLVVRVAGPLPEGARVRVGGHDLPRALWGLDQPVTPGRVLVEAEAPGAAPFVHALDVVAGATAQVDVALHPREGAHAAPTPAPHAARPTPAAATSSPLGPILTVAGAVMLAGGAGIGLASDAVYGALHDECTSAAGCPTSDASRGRDQVGRLDTAANWTMLGGAIVGLAGGLIWFASSPRGHAPARREGVAVAVGPGALGLRGAF